MPEEFISDPVGMDLVEVDFAGEKFVIAGNGMFVTMPLELWEKVYVAASIGSVQTEVE